MFYICYLVIPLLFMQTTQGKGGSYLYDIHFWMGRDTSQVYFLCLFHLSLLSLLRTESYYDLNLKHRLLTLQPFM